MKRANFLIIGAAKCGTSSLYHYLAQHPLIDFPEIKEPKYFSFNEELLKSQNLFIQKLNKFTIKSENEYNNLFANLSGDYIGEASPGYLHSKIAPIRIRDYNENMKFIVMLRNPVDRAYSSWKHNIRMGLEDIKNFRKVIMLSGKRNKDSKYIYSDYLEKGLYSKHLKYYYKYFPSKNFHIIFFEDFILDPNHELNKVVKFLNPKNKEMDFLTDSKHMVNVNSPKFLWLNKLSKRTYFRFPSISKWIIKLNKIGSIKTQDHMYLLNFYKEDINQLELLTGRDLSSWRKSSLNISLNK